MPQFDLLQHHAWKYYDIGILRYLKLYKCDRIAPQVEHQQSLKELHMAGANLKELPSWIGNLCTLEALAIVGYSLEVLPPFSLTYLKNLKILLRRNRLDCSTCPITFYLKKNLRGSDVERLKS